MPAWPTTSSLLSTPEMMLVIIPWVPLNLGRRCPRQCTCCHLLHRSGNIMCAGRCQVLRLGPGVEQRLLSLLRDRILPVAQKSLRLWKKGDAYCRRPPDTLHSML